MNEKTESYVPRITQRLKQKVNYSFQKLSLIVRETLLDAKEFDKEIHNLLKHNILEITKYLEPGFLNNVKPEIDLLIKLLVFRYSLMKSNSSFGQQLLSVQYNENLTGRRAVWFSLLNYIIPYLKSKYDDLSLNWKNEQVKTAVDKIELIVRVGQLLNLIVFLRNGVYPNLIDRLVGVKIVPKTRLNRNVGYSYMTRELIWHGFMELFTFVLPLINYQYIKKRIFRTFMFKPNQSTIQKSVNYNAKTVCSICSELPVYPCRISLYCGHIACYYCIKSNVLADPEYTCSVCGVKNTADMFLDTIYIQ